MTPAIASFPSLTAITAEAIHPSPLGVMRSSWTSRGLHRITWTSPSPSPSPSTSTSLEPDPTAAGGTGADVERRIELFRQALVAYFAGDCGPLDSVEVDRAGWSPFFAAVYDICRSIPAGQTLTYRQIAEQAGSPRAARAVGQAMAANRVILVIPCHRVVSSSGRLGGYSGPGGLTTKRWLLDHEQR